MHIDRAKIMKTRHHWLKALESAWQERTIVWLSGVRRVGKTSLAQMLPNTEYFDCELPRVRRQMEDPEAFLSGIGRGRIVLDEIHRLPNPSELLKIAADHFKGLRILATGSSTLSASTKFKDTLVGRKRDVWLTPMIEADLEEFGNPRTEHRLLFGGLPPFFLSKKIPEADFQDWMDGYWAKDIQELFRLERRQSFQKFVELVLVQSGGIFEATRFTSPCEVSRTSISNYLSILEQTYVAHIVRPFNTQRSREIITAPRVYGFDTGFVANYRGWLDLRKEDLGILWEHLVLNELHGCLQTRKINYWRDKSGHEIDFVFKTRDLHIAIECKWSSTQFEPSGIAAFRRVYRKGPNYVVCHDVERTFDRQVGDIKVTFLSLKGITRKLIEHLKL
jgi:predicted AAA+ superfamily ATPase